VKKRGGVWPPHIFELMEREFKGVWIPSEIWLDARLTLVEKALYAEIDSFSGNGRTFHKSNETIQLEYGVSRPTISKAIKKLTDLGFISAAFDGRMRHLTVQADRKILSGRGKESFGQTVKNLRAEGKNSTSTNTIERTVENTSKKRGTRPKDLDEVLESFKEVGAEESEALAFFDYYEANGWTQGRNKPIKDWKAAARGWIRRSHQFKKNERQNKRTGPADGSLIAEHLRRLAADSGESMG
jgi:DNA-binding transcriptional ArsR family regulator